jgi:hypothetical protein
MTKVKGKVKYFKTIAINVLVFFLLACGNRGDLFFDFVEKNCGFDDIDMCSVDLRSYFDLDFDTMFVFGEYTQIEGVRLILGRKEYDNTNIRMPKGFLVEDSYNKIVLKKDGVIVYDKDVKSPYLYNMGIEVEMVGLFDGEPFTHRGKMFTSSKLLVKKVNHEEGDYLIYESIIN